MFSKLSRVGLAATVVGASLLVGGCASTAQRSGPYALTGETERGAQVSEVSEQRRFTDDKGHYRPDWRYSSDPSRYAKF